METVSEIPKRGRPRKHTLVIERMIWSEVTTTRGLQNKHYQCEACEILKGDDRFRWLWDLPHGRLRLTILAEIGRLGHPESMREAAEILCEVKPTSQVAVRWLRQIRLEHFRTLKRQSQTHAPNTVEHAKL